MHNSLDINFATDTLLSDEVDPILSPREDLMKLDEEVIVRITFSGVCIT
jgi:hypothetical protein